MLLIECDGVEWEATMAGLVGSFGGEPPRARGRNVVFKRQGAGSMVVMGEVRDVVSIRELSPAELRDALRRSLRQAVPPT